MPNLKKTEAVTTKPIAMKLQRTELHVYAPRTPEEADTRNVFTKGDVTYCHFNGSVESGKLGTAGTTGLVLCYGELADKLGDFVFEAHHAGRNDRERKLTIEADINVEITPVADGDGVITGNRVTLKVYGFGYGNSYYTTLGGALKVTARNVQEAPSRTTKRDFFPR